jgi:chromosome segregation ATPase
MVVEQLAAQVAGVLARAESLFAAPDILAEDDPALRRITDAADAARTIAARTGEWSGATADQHQQTLAASTEGLDHTADIDARLADRLDENTEQAQSGHHEAGELRSAAEDLPGHLDEWADLPVTVLGALKALRGQLADMQQLMARQQGRAADTAGQLRELDYGG